MAKQTYLPMSSTGDLVLVKKGDIIETVTGERYIFIESRRTKWSGMHITSRKIYNIPEFMNVGKPYAVKVVGQDLTVLTPTTDPLSMKLNDLFQYGVSKETFVFKGIGTSGNKTYIKAIDLGNGKQWRLVISKGLTEITAIDLEKVLKQQFND